MAAAARAAIDRCLAQLRRADAWVEQAEGLDALEALARGSAAERKALAGDAGRYRSIIGLVLQCLGSLRSALSKRAAQTLAALFEELGTASNRPLASALVPSLAKRVGDNTNAFIRAQARAALLAYCTSCPSADTALCLLGLARHRLVPLRVAALEYLGVCFDANPRLDAELIAGVQQACLDLRRDAHPDVRDAARDLADRIERG
eukprot:CAMPEP_0202086252 /NCGR_PEP_ID=MMETSP0964-20121228/32986_1 /ASSEMBLY_ACC=CAM_ASM_000500 /TAXON_ID=4773 /ORGANISM="Schizochytrium aggregatum, Strain ATCC28209" /LENGTH=204 /DNA_ID=CAMNT_0048654137 /DNA_START=1 /DNA_END=611 /DNA_ORIENTATION=-